VISGLPVSVFIPPLAVIQWFSGRLTGCQLLQLIQLGITIVFSATGFHFFLWQVNYLLFVSLIAQTIKHISLFLYILHGYILSCRRYT